MNKLKIACKIGLLCGAILSWIVTAACAFKGQWTEATYFLIMAIYLSYKSEQ